MAEQTLDAERSALAGAFACAVHEAQCRDCLRSSRLLDSIRTISKLRERLLRIEAEFPDLGERVPGNR